MPAINTLIFPAAINGVALAGEAPPIDLFRFDFDNDSVRVGKTSAMLDASSVDYSALRKRNGKLLLYAGMSDPVFSANDLIRYFRSVTEASGGAAEAGKLRASFSSRDTSSAA